MTKLLIVVAILCWQGNPGPAGDFEGVHSAGLDADQVADGWLALFDGQGMYGWRSEADVQWAVKDGCLVASGGAVGLLRTAVQFADFELRLEYKAAESTNSGVFIRTSPRPQHPEEDCFEINIAPPTHPFPTGSIVGRQKAKPVAWKDGWNAMRILADGDKVKVWINDDLQLDHEVNKKWLVHKGYIGLQHNDGQVAFRNVRLKPLNMNSLIDGENLESWNSDQSLASQFKIDADKNLRMLGGWGQLESKKSFADFVFSTHVKTNAPGLNSGIFFRCIQGEVMNGYESQIQNVFLNGDRTKPEDCGTGGIFRRQNARFVNANDQAWFAKTIVTNGSTMCVWVNGVMVTDWTDQRRPDPNPRKGRRLTAGTFCLQGHDPTTDVSFRKMLVKELPHRR